jgi:hypothetical protein
MCGTTFVVRRYAAIAAVAALSAGCAGGELSDGRHASAAPSDVRVRTPLVDDDGWPMPADPPTAHTAPAAGALQAVK